MVQTAAHLVDNILPFVAFRQVVFTLPKRLRFFLKNPRCERGIRRILLNALQTTIRNASPGAPSDSRLGAVVFTHKSGASLNRHPHFHVLTTSGTFTTDAQGALVFFPATELDNQSFCDLTQVVRRRTLRYLVRHDLLDEWDALKMLTWQANGGFSVHGSVTTAADDRFGLERLIRYCARPAFAGSRLGRIDNQAEQGQETLIYKLPPGDVLGRQYIKLTPMELLDRLAALIPPPRRHRHTYAGVFAPHSALRPLVAAGAGPDPALAVRLHQAAQQMGLAEELGPNNYAHEGSQHALKPLAVQDDTNCPKPASTSCPSRRARRASVRWAMLMARIFEILPLKCPRCGQQMKIISFITQPEVIEKILNHLGEPTRPPPISPARSPPQPELDFDQTLCW